MSASAFDPAHDLQELRGLQDELDRLAALDEAVLQRAVPGRSGWSSAQHLAHVALANELVLRNLASLAAGSGMLIVRGGAQNPRALELLAAGRLPRGVAQAPRMVRPPERVELASVREWLADGRRALAALAPAMLLAGELRIPHQLLGPLDAPQWARFAVVHTRHHLAIVSEILAERAPAPRE